VKEKFVIVDFLLYLWCYGKTTTYSDSLQLCDRFDRDKRFLQGREY